MGVRQFYITGGEPFIRRDLLDIVRAICTDSENFNEFRDATGPGLESGVQALFDGDATGLDTIVDTIISGLFVIFAPDADSSN